MKRSIQNVENLSGIEVDLVKLGKSFYFNRGLIIKIIMSSFIIGVFYAVISPKQFTAKSTFVPQTGDGGRISSGNLGGLASIAGINLGGSTSSSDIPPSLYPKIVESVNFKKALLAAPISFEGNNYTTYEDFYNENFKPGLLGQLRGYIAALPRHVLGSGIEEEAKFEINGDFGNFVQLNSNQISHFARLESQIKITPHESEGYVQLEFSMPEPVMAAQMAKYAEDLLQAEVISYKIQIAREQMIFTQERFEEKKSEFEEKQKQLAYFRDRNQNISSAVAMNQMEKLEAEYSFAFSIYTELAKELEQSRLMVKKNTPVFSVINPITVPTSKSAPNRKLIIILFTLFGIIAAFIIVLGKEFLKGIQARW